MCRQIDGKGRVTDVKHGDKRLVPISDRWAAAYLAAPRLSDRRAMPAPRGGPMKLSNWHAHWAAIRSLGGRPGFEFYELKHRAITWMVTPGESGGLGLDVQTVALICGHQDAGATIVKHYLKLNERDAVARVRDAMGRRAAGGSRQLRAVS